jgi:hypothetical protein
MKQCVPTLRATVTSDRSRSRGRGIENVLSLGFACRRIFVDKFESAQYEKGLTSRIHTFYYRGSSSAEV